MWPKIDFFFYPLRDHLIENGKKQLFCLGESIKFRGCVYFVIVRKHVQLLASLLHVLPV